MRGVMGRRFVLEVLRGCALHRFADGQADALGVGIHGQDLHIDFLAGLDHVLNALNAGGRNLGNMNQTIHAGLQLDERAEGADAHDFTG